MLALATRRMLNALITIWLAVTLAFILLRLLPGDAFTARLSLSGASQTQIESRRALLGLDAPLLNQYVSLITNLLQGDLGYSLVSGRKVKEMILEPFGSSLVLAGGAMVVGIVMGASMGVTAALGRSRLSRVSAWLIAFASVSSPIYWTNTLAILLFSVGLKWLPSIGAGAGIRPLILPWLVLGFTVSGGMARLVGTVLNELKDSDFARTARAKGLSQKRITYVHLLRAGAGTIITFIMLQIGFLLSGTVVTEMIFVRPGIGTVLLSAIHDQDFPVVQGVVILSALIYCISITIAEVTAGLLDPRLRMSSL